MTRRVMASILVVAVTCSCVAPVYGDGSCSSIYSSWQSAIGRAVSAAADLAAAAWDYINADNWWEEAKALARMALARKRMNDAWSDASEHANHYYSHGCGGG